ncbi:aminoglycoside phosphotransferase family protein [Actinopolymorpha alba]|uniref:aminoglycoside phosphotransferase family protein n=1 Tax=Actinopolymorpha alba TaxID=533267 RepID=UPI0003679C8C|nr:aminoglycoside phosphotransferase family protein [Actinopolymorpha alba]
MTNPWNTHGIEMRHDVVIKRFRPGDAGQAIREWRALSLLAARAPGIAPMPVKADLVSETPTVVMARLTGEPLRGKPVSTAQLEGMVSAVTRLQESAIPPGLMSDLPVRRWQQEEVIARLRAWSADGPGRGAPPVVVEAVRAGLAWLARAGLEAKPAAGVVPVFGHGDGNLANYLWDGSRVRLVDFEDSGRSDRAFELAEITEHVSAWVDGALDVEAFLSYFELSDAERARLRDCRRLLALVWLFLLAREDPAHPRNPPGTLVRQAHRLLDLLT